MPLTADSLRQHILESLESLAHSVRAADGLEQEGEAFWDRPNATPEELAAVLEGTSWKELQAQVVMALRQGRPATGGP